MHPDIGNIPEFCTILDDAHPLLIRIYICIRLHSRHHSAEVTQT